MANTFNTIAGDVIARQALEFLTSQYPVISTIAKDFSDAPVLKGQTLISRINSVPAASDFVEGTGYAASAASAVDVPVTLDKHKHATIEITEAELSGTNINRIEELSQALAYSIGDALMTDISALLTYTNFPQETVTTLANFTRVNAIVKPKGVLRGRKISSGLTLLASSDAEAKLWEDDSFISLLTNKAGGIGATELPQTHGVNIARNDFMPTGLNGAVIGNDALLLVTRTPLVESDVVNGIIKNVSDANGLTLQYRKYHDPKLAKVVISYTLMYGVAKGRTTAVQLLPQAAHA
jgi:hypothetical protein